jgi:hypothetical protein
VDRRARALNQKTKAAINMTGTPEAAAVSRESTDLGSEVKPAQWKYRRRAWKRARVATGRSRHVYTVTSAIYRIHERRPPGESRLRPRYFFLLAAAFAFVACCDVMSACFFRSDSFAFDCFCEACFCTDFGDRSPMGSIVFVLTVDTRSRYFPRDLPMKQNALACCNP